MGLNTQDPWLGPKMFFYEKLHFSHIDGRNQEIGFSLPENLKSCVSLESFKESIKEWIPTNCKCDLCKTYLPGVGYVNVTEQDKEATSKQTMVMKEVTIFTLQ